MAGTRNTEETDAEKVGEDKLDTEISSKVENRGTDSAIIGEANTSEEGFKEAQEEAKDRYLRLAAEFENYKKRVAREYERIANSASEKILLGVLEVIDNFERALNTTEQYQKDKSMDTQKLFESLHQGAQMIHQQLLGVLESHGVKEIDAQGKPFDPLLHEATLQIESDLPPEHVAGVLSKGYTRGDRVLRHAKVSVSKGAGKSQIVGEKSEDKEDDKG